MIHLLLSLVKLREKRLRRQREAQLQQQQQADSQSGMHKPGNLPAVLQTVGTLSTRLSI